MKKALIAGFAVVMAAAAFTPSAFAKDFSNLRVDISKNINSDCGLPDGYDPIMACYSQTLPKSGSAVGTIHIREDIPASLLPSVFMKNVGQFLVFDLSEQELKNAFNPAPQVLLSMDIRDVAANAFAYWALGGRVSYSEEQLFRNLLSK